MSNPKVTQQLADAAYMGAVDELNEYAIYKKFSELRLGKPEFKKTL